jgi:hypothetical protein
MLVGDKKTTSEYKFQIRFYLPQRWETLSYYFSLHNRILNVFDKLFMIQGEVRCLYRAFKQECPNGIVDEETFKEVYEKIFPLGDATHYAHLVFAAIDR